MCLSNWIQRSHQTSSTKSSKEVPFLNGGLFENLDKNIGSENEIRIDCFSNALKNEERLKVPDSLFFEEEIVDLSDDYGDNKQTNKKVIGTFFKRFKNFFHDI